MKALRKFEKSLLLLFLCLEATTVRLERTATARYAVEHPDTAKCGFSFYHQNRIPIQDRVSLLVMDIGGRSNVRQTCQSAGALTARGHLNVGRTTQARHAV